MSLDIKDIESIRSIAGLPPAKFTTYYNLAGPDRRMAEGRINGTTKFVLEMEQDEYEKTLRNIQDQKEHYKLLFDLYSEKEKVKKEESDGQTD